jgi:lysophospholipase L1-like esterase
MRPIAMLTAMLAIAIAPVITLADTNTTPPMKERIRIVALGDSTTAGTPGWRSPIESPPAGTGNEQSQYAYWLMRAHPEWEVLNRGVNGERTDAILARFDRDVVDAKPRAVVIIAGVNDVYQGRPVQEVESHLSRMYARAWNAHISVVAGTIIPYDTATPEHHEKMHQINAWVRQQATSDHQVVTAESREAVASKTDRDRLISSPDGLHPSPDAYRLMAEAIRVSLERIVP